MKALKGLVIGMGILILLGLGVVVAALVGEVNDAADAPAKRTVSLDLPPDCRVAGMRAVDDHLALRVTGPDGAACPALLVFDPASGAVRTVVHTATGARAAAPDGQS
jgi:hypothetical protein